MIGDREMNSTPQIFKEKLINGRLSHFTKDDITDFDKKFHEISLWHKSCTEKDLEKTKETSVQGLFMTRLFQGVFGYSEIVDAGDCYNQIRESKTVLDTTESDGALGFFYKSTGVKDIRVVIELKDAKTSLDKKQNRSSHLTPVEQAFQYANKNGSKCGWVIVSNFIETRLYKSTSSLEYEVFDMTKMNDEKEFLRFYFFMCKENLIDEHGKSIIDELYIENEAEGIDISNKFYKDYKIIRNNLFASLKENNPDKDELLLFTKTQKLMDRFTFICFCEDCNLLPQNVYQKLIDNAKNSFSFSPTKLWEQLKGLFASIDKGNPPMRINRYNGGLFKADTELDELVIPDDVLESFTTLSSYDFNSDLNVNILGQIFEQSISDVEQIKEEISGVEIDKGKQKDDGIFYTPYYVTRYIVEQTVGAYLSRRKEELKREIFKKGAITVEAIKPSTGRKNTRDFTSWIEIPVEHENMSEDEVMDIKFAKELHRVYWLAYEEVLKNIKICDPACGSGAFLNQCFDYLHEEMDYVLDMRYQYDGQYSMFDIDKSILQNNLYGVDINPESVEITKLSLWLKTAKSNQTLATLDENIKCGNSIVADSKVVDNAFNWHNEFSDVFKGGGFDVIVGNPPYGAKLSQEQKDYLTDNYITTEYNFDTYKTFFELGFNILKRDGYLGFITPNTFFTLELGANKLRKYLYDEHILCNIVEVYNVFPTAVVEPVITIFKNSKPLNEKFESICIPRKTVLTSTFLNEGIVSEYVQDDLKKDSQYIFNYRSTDNEKKICELMQKNKRLDTMFDVMTGAKPYQKGKGNPPQTKDIVENKPYTGYEQLDETWKPYYRGKYIERYQDKWQANKEYIRYGEWLAEPRSKEVFDGEKIFIRQTGDTLIANYDEGNVSNNTLHSIYPLESNKEVGLFYLLGILNSSLMNWYYQKVNYLEIGKPMAEVKGIYIKKLPIAVVNEEQRKTIENDVKSLLEICQKLCDEKIKFIHYIIQVYEPKKTTEKMDNFDAISFKEFCTELKKQKVKLSPSEQMELLTLFENTVKSVSVLRGQAKVMYKKIDDAIYSIYGIDEQTAHRIKVEMPIEI